MNNIGKKKIHLWLPKHIEWVCETLEKGGYAAYAVGGCVRDLLLGRVPGDYDVTTAAKPETVKALFPHTADTGLSHGTVTVILPEGNVEVTTFREDGAYRDSRRPDTVRFLPTVEGDLARRDFTVNAMAFSPTRGFCDPFSGLSDLESKTLRTVGDPSVRFREDALRILRLYRFSAQLSFSIEEETRLAADGMAPSLLLISKERIFAELSKLLSAGTASELENAKVVLSAVMPHINFAPETFKSVAACPVTSGKWAHLLGESTKETLRDFHAPRKLILSATELAEYKKGAHIIADIAALRHTSPEEFFAFLQDEKAEKEWREAVLRGAPARMEALSISGKDLLEIGFYGREISDVLHRLFMYAIENPANNKTEILREVATWIYKQEHSQKA